MPSLKNDITSKTKIIAKQGDQVKIIASHENVLIVEGSAGRFAVLATELSDEAIEAKPEIETAIRIPNNPTSKKAASRTKPINNAPGLF